MAWRALSSICVVACVCVCSPGTLASEISGKIIVQKNLDRPSIATTYELRGVAVRTAPPENGAATFERVAIWLETAGAKPASPVTAVMQQQNRRFEPELLIVPVGSTVEFPNLDPIFHNIFSLSKTQAFDLGYYPKGKSRSVTFRRSGVVQVYCHVHPNMYGVVVVTSSRWFGKPGGDGRFVWADVPPGKYRLVAWQKFAGLFAREIVVPPTGILNIAMAIPEDPENR